MKMTISPIPIAKYVANALVLYVYVGDYSLPLDHFVLVRSDI